jgi:hypothetical protein
MSAALKIEATTHEELMQCLVSIGVRGVSAMAVPVTDERMAAVKELIRMLYIGHKTDAIKMVKEHFQVSDGIAVTFVESLFNDYFTGVEVQ